MKVIWAPLALDRAAEIARYIAADRPAAAGRWVDGLLRLGDGLIRSPKRGRIVPELGRDDSKRVVVLTVRHARREFDAGEVG